MDGDQNFLLSNSQGRGAGREERKEKEEEEGGEGGRRGFSKESSLPHPQARELRMGCAKEHRQYQLFPGVKPALQVL